MLILVFRLYKGVKVTLKTVKVRPGNIDPIPLVKKKENHKRNKNHKKKIITITSMDEGKSSARETKVNRID